MDSQFVFVDRSQRIAQPLIKLAGQTVQIRRVLMTLQLPKALKSFRKITRFFISQHKIVGIVIHCCVYSICSLEQRDRFLVSAGVEIEFTKLMIFVKTPWGVGKGRT